MPVRFFFFFSVFFVFFEGLAFCFSIRRVGTAIASLFALPDSVAGLIRSGG